MNVNWGLISSNRQIAMVSLELSNCNSFHPSSLYLSLFEEIENKAVHYYIKSFRHFCLITFSRSVTSLILIIQKDFGAKMMAFA